MTDYNEYFEGQVKELKADPDVDRVYAGKMLQTVTAYKVFDNSMSGVGSIELEEGDDVFVTVEHDGTWAINFPSIYPNTYLYRYVGLGSMADNEDVRIELPLKEL